MRYLSVVVLSVRAPCPIGVGVIGRVEVGDEASSGLE
jgi:hypothetical protein